MPFSWMMAAGKAASGGDVDETAVVSDQKRKKNKNNKKRTVWKMQRAGPPGDVVSCLRDTVGGQLVQGSICRTVPGRLKAQVVEGELGGGVSHP